MKREAGRGGTMERNNFVVIYGIYMIIHEKYCKMHVECPCLMFLNKREQMSQKNSF